jgi:hypothetical protein
MQALSPEQYDRLRRLAKAWQQQSADSLKASPRYNPRLTVDALCFQRRGFQSRGFQRRDDYLVGALVTPVSLSLVLVPADTEVPPPAPGTRQTFTLPSGRYPFVAEPLAPPLWLWRCELLDDLSDLASLQEASRLAQQLMDRVMTPVS